MSKMAVFIASIFFYNVTTFAASKLLTEEKKEEVKRTGGLLAQELRQRDVDAAMFTLDNSLYSTANTFGESDQMYGLDLILKSIHSIGLFVGGEKGMNDDSNSIQWGASVGIASPQDKSKKLQQVLKWRMVGVRYFRNYDFGEVYTAFEYGLRYRILKNMSVISMLRGELLRRGQAEEGSTEFSSVPRLGGSISASIGLSFNLF